MQMDTSNRITIAGLFDDLAASVERLRADRAGVVASRETLEARIADGGATYGVNTGFGKLAGQRIEADRLSDLQRNLLVSHAVGVGPYLEESECRWHTQRDRGFD